MGPRYLDEEGGLGKVQVGLSAIEGDLEAVQLVQVVFQGGGDVDIPVAGQVAGAGGERGWVGGLGCGVRRGERRGRRHVPDGLQQVGKAGVVAVRHGFSLSVWCDMCACACVGVCVCGVWVGAATMS